MRQDSKILKHRYCPFHQDESKQGRGSRASEINIKSVVARANVFLRASPAKDLLPKRDVDRELYLLSSRLKSILQTVSIVRSPAKTANPAPPKH